MPQILLMFKFRYDKYPRTICLARTPTNERRSRSYFTACLAGFHYD
jgi:hypothetical protein